MTASTLSYLFTPPAPASIAIVGHETRFPVRRVFCIGRNYEEHAREMKATVSLDAPVFFTKPADALVTDGPNPKPQTPNPLPLLALLLASFILSTELFSDLLSQQFRHFFDVLFKHVVTDSRKRER